MLEVANSALPRSLADSLVIGAVLVLEPTPAQVDGSFTCTVA